MQHHVAMIFGNYTSNTNFSAASISSSPSKWHRIAFISNAEQIYIIPAYPL